ncbi:MAG: hypothetical protein JW969_06575 [Spirochaetales bacterium]|nr:hypothetical protein [Spirochaetales bacterium]
MLSKTKEFNGLLVHYANENTLEQAKDSRISYEIENLSDSYIVFGMGKEEYGGIYEEGGKYYYDSLMQQATPPVFFFFSAIIPPGAIESFTITTLQLESGSRSFVANIEFYRFNEANIKNLFIPDDGPNELSVFQENIVYTPLADMGEFVSLIKDNKRDFLFPVENQEQLRELITFSIPVTVNMDKDFQPLYDKFKPTAIARLKNVADFAFSTNQGTILIKGGDGENIGNVDLAALNYLETVLYSENNESLLVWIEPVDGPVKELLRQYGAENNDDLMYHGQFQYSLKLPREELQNFFSCIKTGKYWLRYVSELMYSGELWLIENTH